MRNAPKVVIEYIASESLSIDPTGSTLNSLSDYSNINTGDFAMRGKKGLHLSGGAVDPQTGEESGCLLDGTYTFYESNYNGILGNINSSNNNTFSSSQYFTVQTTSNNSYIKNLIIYFDTVANEYATSITLTAKKYDVETGTIIDDLEFGTKTFTNNKSVLVIALTGFSTIVSIKATINSWSKKNALMKITGLATGYTSEYTQSSIKSLKWDNNLFGDETEQLYGISINSGQLTVIDKNKGIYELYTRGLIGKDSPIEIFMDEDSQGIFYIQDYNSERGSNLWVFEFVDKYSLFKDSIVDVLQVTSNMMLSGIITYAIRDTGFIIDWDEKTKQICDEIIIPTAFIQAGQTLDQFLLKCCQVGLLRMYFSHDKLRIVRSANE